jgi:outer membrane protein assembly factor BamB
VVAGGKIWLTNATDEGHSLRAVAIDLETGRVTFDEEIFAPANPVHINAKNSHASPSPVLDDAGRVYVHFGVMGTACLDADTGKTLWKTTDIKLDHKEGPGSSPILWKKLLILNCDGIDEQYVVAIDQSTGKVVWRTDRPKPIHPDFDQCKAYATPLVIETQGRSELISPGAMRVVSYDPATGKEWWRVNYSGYSNVPRPLFGHGLVYICTGYTKPQIWAIKPGGDGDVTDTHVVWKFERQVSANPSPILVDKQIYFVSNTGVLTCLGALTGQAVYTARLGGNFSASPVLAGGKLYFCSEEGVTSIVEPGSEFKRVAENSLDGGHMASPVFVNKALLLRTDKALYRIETGATPARAN